MLMFYNLDLMGSSSPVLAAANSSHFQVIYNTSLFVCVYLSLACVAGLLESIDS